MAKKKTFGNLNPKKPTNQEIESLISGEENIPIKQKLVQFNIKLPQNLYDALNKHSNKTGLSKKAIVVQALLESGIMDT